jgi:hypothetical protein
MENDSKGIAGVFVRLAGLASILMSLFDFYYVVVKTLGIETTSKVALSWDVRGLVLYLALGIVLIIGANPIVRLAYWREDQERHGAGA